MRLALLSFTLLLIAGCSSAIPTPLERKATLLALASEYNLTIEPLQTPNFSLSAIVSDKCDDNIMRIYIEGDGLSWITRSRLSEDPTPINPLAAKLMLMDPSECKAYISRPCQYTQEKGCNPQVWSSHRFGRDVIDSYDDALDGLKKKYNLSSFTLVGYSGGGAVATLVASHRSDINQLITVAGNLDIKKWIEWHGIEPLNGSLNPVDQASKLQHIPQMHLIGSKDRTIPKEIFLSYKSHCAEANKMESIDCTECTHTQGWETAWGDYLKNRD